VLKRDVAVFKPVTGVAELELPETNSQCINNTQHCRRQCWGNVIGSTQITLDSMNELSCPSVSRLVEVIVFRFLPAAPPCLRVPTR